MVNEGEREREGEREMDGQTDRHTHTYDFWTTDILVLWAHEVQQSAQSVCKQEYLICAVPLCLSSLAA